MIATQFLKIVRMKEMDLFWLLDIGMAPDAPYFSISDGSSSRDYDRAPAKIAVSVLG